MIMFNQTRGRLCLQQQKVAGQSAENYKYWDAIGSEYFSLPSETAIEKGILPMDQPLTYSNDETGMIVALEAATYVLGHPSLESVSVDGKAFFPDPQDSNSLQIELSSGWHSIQVNKKTLDTRRSSDA